MNIFRKYSSSHGETHSPKPDTTRTGFELIPRFPENTLWTTIQLNLTSGPDVLIWDGKDETPPKFLISKRLLIYMSAGKCLNLMEICFLQYGVENTILVSEKEMDIHSHLYRYLQTPSYRRLSYLKCTSDSDIAKNFESSCTMLCRMYNALLTIGITEPDYTDPILIRIGAIITRARQSGLTTPVSAIAILETHASLTSGRQLMRIVFDTLLAELVTAFTTNPQADIKPYLECCEVPVIAKRIIGTIHDTLRHRLTTPEPGAPQAIDVSVEAESDANTTRGWVDPDTDYEDSTVRRRDADRMSGQRGHQEGYDEDAASEAGTNSVEERGSESGYECYRTNKGKGLEKRVRWRSDNGKALDDV